VTGVERVSVLVADHDRWTRLNLSTMLDEAGLAVSEASNGVSALRVALAQTPHLVILGAELPEMDAAELVQRLRADARTRHTAIIGPRSVADTDASLELPSNALELLATVVEALDARSQAVDAAPIRSVMASARATWPLAAGASSRATSRIRNAGRSGKWRLSSGIETL
jgi:CheY-like chemotaxis protein